MIKKKTDLRNIFNELLLTNKALMAVKKYTKAFSKD